MGAYPKKATIPLKYLLLRVIEYGESIFGTIFFRYGVKIKVKIN